MGMPKKPNQIPQPTYPIGIDPTGNSLSSHSRHNFSKLGSTVRLIPVSQDLFGLFYLFR
jgi:hypothetical protein